MELGLLEVVHQHSGMPLSLAELYSFLSIELSSVCSLDSCVAYLHLCRLGFALMRMELFLKHLSTTISGRIAEPTRKIFEQVCSYACWMPSRKEQFKKADPDKIPDFIAVIVSCLDPPPCIDIFERISEFQGVLE